MVKVRRKIENWEGLFGIEYPYNYKKPDRKSMVIKVYDFHFEKWCWIWENCTDHRWLNMKADFETQSIDKERACRSIASLLSLAGHNVHFRSEIKKIKKEEILKILDDDFDLDEISLKCVNILYRK